MDKLALSDIKTLQSKDGTDHVDTEPINTYK